MRRKPEVDVLETRNGPLQVAALPYTSPSNLAAEGSSIQDISVSIRDRLGKMLDMLIQRLDADLPAVLMSHFSLIGAVPGSEKAIMLGREVTLRRLCKAGAGLCSSWAHPQTPGVVRKASCCLLRQP